MGEIGSHDLSHTISTSIFCVKISEKQIKFFPIFSIFKKKKVEFAKICLKTSKKNCIKKKIRKNVMKNSVFLRNIFSGLEVS